MPTINELITTGFQKLDQIIQGVTEHTSSVTELAKNVASTVDVSTSTKRTIDAMANTLDHIVVDTRQLEELKRVMGSLNTVIMALSNELSAGEEQMTIRELLWGINTDTEKILQAVAGEMHTDRPLRFFRGQVTFWKLWSRSSSFGWTFARIADPDSPNLDILITRDIKAQLVLSLSSVIKVPLRVAGSVIHHIDVLPKEIQKEIEDHLSDLWEGQELVVHWLEYVEIDRGWDPVFARDTHAVEARAFGNRIVARVSRNNRGHTGIHPALFSLKTLHKPGTPDFALGSVREIGDGCYELTLAPDPPSFRWERGSYLLALTVSVGSQEPTALVTV